MTENEKKSIEIVAGLVSMSNDSYTRSKAGLLEASETRGPEFKTWVLSLLNLADDMRNGR